MICVAFCFCRLRRRKQAVSRTDEHNRVKSMSPKSSMSVDMGEFCSATTPQLTSINRTMGSLSTTTGTAGSPFIGTEMNALELNRHSAAVTPGLDPVEALLQRAASKEIRKGT